MGFRVLVGWEIAALGTRDSLEAVAYRPRYIDLGGNFTYPGFTDAHVHLIGLGLQLQSLQLQGLSLAEVLGKVKASAEQAPAGSWIIGRGFNFNNWPEGKPRKEWLDRVAPWPSGLTAKDGHLMWQTALLCKHGVQRDAKPQHGLIEQDSLRDQGC